MIFLIPSSMSSRAPARVVDLPDPVGAGDEDDAVAGPQPASEHVEMIGFHAEVFERLVAAVLVEQAQHDGLAEGARHGGDADVHVLAGDAFRDAPVLGKTTLGDVDAGHQLDA